MTARFIQLTVIIGSLGLLAACDQAPPQETVIDAQIDALEQAQEVEQVLMDRATDLQRKLESEVDSDPPN